MRITGPERAGPEVTGRLGALYLRLGQLDDAIRWLRHAQGPIAAADHATAAVYLATALAARGQMASALDVLVNAVPPHTGYFTDPVTLVSFALAVHYDRDELCAHPVHEVLQDYQGNAHGGDGDLRLFTFRGNAIEVRTYSPWLDRFTTDGSKRVHAALGALSRTLAR